MFLKLIVHVNFCFMWNARFWNTRRKIRGQKPPYSSHHNHKPHAGNWCELWCFLSSFIRHWTMIVGGSIIRLNHLWKCGKPNSAPRTKLMPLRKKNCTPSTHILSFTIIRDPVPFPWTRREAQILQTRRRWFPPHLFSLQTIKSVTRFLPTWRKGHELWKCWSGIHFQHIIVTYIIHSNLIYRYKCIYMYVL